MADILVPVEGQVSWFNGFDLDPEKTLREGHPEGQEGSGGIINIPLKRNDALIATVKVTLSPDREINRRAMAMVAALTDIYFVFRGPVLFEGVAKEEAVTLIEEFG